MVIVKYGRVKIMVDKATEEQKHKALKKYSEINIQLRTLHNNTSILKEKLFLYQRDPTEFTYTDSIIILELITKIEKDCQSLILKLS